MSIIRALPGIFAPPSGVDTLPFPRAGRVMTANTTTIDSQTYIASAAGSTASREAWSSFNTNAGGGGGNNSLGGWACNFTPSWIRIQFPATVVANAVNLFASNSYHPTVFTVRGSVTTDQNDWVVLGTFNVPAGTWGGTFLRQFTFTNSVGYRRYEINITAVQSAEPTQWSQFGFIQYLLV